MQFNKEEWTKNMLKKISDRYGDLSEWDRSKINLFLHTDWCHSSGRLLTIIANLVGYGVGALTQIPFSLFNIQLLSSIGLAAGYIASQIGIAFTIGSNLSRLPAYDAITDQQLESLFKKADDIGEFMALISKLEKTYREYDSKNDKTMLAELGGFVVGGVVTSQVVPKATWLGAVALSRSLPKIFSSEYSIVKSVVDIPFEDRLDKATNTKPAI